MYRLNNPTSLLKCQDTLKFRIRVFARPFVATPQIPEKKEKKQVHMHTWKFDKFRY